MEGQQCRRPVRARSRHAPPTPRRMVGRGGGRDRSRPRPPRRPRDGAVVRARSLGADRAGRGPDGHAGDRALGGRPRRRRRIDGPRRSTRAFRGSARTNIGAPQSVHRLSMRTDSSAIIATPSMSHAQLANHCARLPTTRYGVSTDEKGPAIQISPVRGCTRSVLPILSSPNARLISSGETPNSSAISPLVGAFPRVIIRSYIWIRSVRGSGVIP